MNIKRNYVVIPVLVLCVALLGGYFTGNGMDRYAMLTLPQGTPSGQVIGMVWTIIYVCAAVSLLLFWNQRPHDKQFGWIIGLFIANGFLNALWCWVFFSKHWLGLAFWWMMVLLVITLLKIIFLWPKHRLASILLWIYPLWIVFASIFAWKISIMN